MKKTGQIAIVSSTQSSKKLATSNKHVDTLKFVVGFSFVLAKSRGIYRKEWNTGVEKLIFSFLLLFHKRIKNTIVILCTCQSRAERGLSRVQSYENNLGKFHN
ncbi:hypothetical protein V6Z12_A11G102700 [Gossypium hirsutum]